MNLDPRTLVFAIALAAFLTGTSMAIAARVYAGGVPLLSRFAVSLFVQGAGWLIIVPLRTLLPEPVCVVFGHGSILLSLALMFTVLVEFQGLRISPVWAYGLVALAGVLLAYFSAVDAEPAMRRLCVSLCSAFLSGASAAVLWGKKRPSGMEWFMGGIFFLCALVFLSRALFFTEAKRASVAPLTPSLLNSITFVTILFGNIAAGTGFLLMCMERSLFSLRKSEDDLEQSMARYQTLVEWSPDAIILQQNGVIVYANPAATTLLQGRSSETLLGRDLMDFVHPDCRAEALQRRTSVEQGVSAPAAEMRALSLDGTEFTVEVQSTEIRYKEGPAICTVARDISDRKKVEAALRRSEAEYEAVYNTAPAMLNSVDAEGRLTNVSNHWLEVLGYTREEVIGRSSIDFLTQESRKFAIETALPEFARHGRCANVEYQLVTKKGKVIDVLLSAQARYENGKIVQAVSVITDVTQRKVMEQQLARAKRLESLAVLAAGIAHDFNNLLTGLFGHLQLIETDSPDMVKRHAARAMAAFDRARGLTHQLLTFERGGTPMKTAVRVNEMLRETAECVLGETNITAEFHLDPGVSPVEGDPNQLKQVLENLLINAREAMPRGGRVEISTRNHPPGSVTIQIADGGPGISELDVPLVFDPFFSTKGKGHGLGLASAYSIVKRHGGLISVSSEPGKGACFTIELPAMDVRILEPIPERTRPGRVLILEDDDAVRSVLGSLLKASGIAAQAFEQSDEALLAYERAAQSGLPFDLVILDLASTEGPDGLETLERLRQFDPHVRAIVSSGFSEHPAMRRPADYGFLDSIGKPWQASVLLETVKRALSTPALQRETPAGHRT